VVVLGGSVAGAGRQRQAGSAEEILPGGPRQPQRQAGAWQVAVWQAGRWRRCGECSSLQIVQAESSRQSKSSRRYSNGRAEMQAGVAAVARWQMQVPELGGGGKWHIPRAGSSAVRQQVSRYPRWHMAGSRQAVYGMLVPYSSKWWQSQ